MKFIIGRTSIYDEKKKPCDEAERGSIENWDVRTCDEAEFDRKLSGRCGLWRDKGKNHKALGNGWIARQLPDMEGWTVTLNNLEELMSFSAKYGKLILKPNGHSNFGRIEIYDDYRE